MKNPLLDIDFLKKLDNETEHEVYARIIALTFDENPVEEITGVVTGGSVNIDGTSAIRRSCSVTLVAQDVNINDFYWGLNTKFKLEIGLKNNIDSKYDDIIWFKQGIFLITSFNTSFNVSSYTISISGKDKMALLNGDIGGKITSLSVDFGTYDNVDADGNITRYDYPIKEIILEAVHQYAKEPYYNIMVNDLDDQGFELMEYRGDVDMFLLIDYYSSDVTNIRFDEEGTRKEQYFIVERNGDTFTPTANKICITDDKMVYATCMEGSDFASAAPEPTYLKTADSDDIYTVYKVSYGQTCGYRLTELIYAGDLIGAIDNSITSALLDKVVQMLGDFEYFYDVDGVFHFQRKRIFFNKSWNTIISNGDKPNSRDEIYADSAAYSSATSYSFTDNNLISAFQNTPDLLNLRNDFAIWGKRKSSSGSDIPIHLRYAIDDKPSYYKAYDGTIYLTVEEHARLNHEQEETKVELTQAIIAEGSSAFKITSLPAGLSDEWWEIFDWARRYLYYADVDNVHSMNYYIQLTDEEVNNIITQATVPSNESVHDFNYYCWQLQINTLGNFSKTWGTEDWLTIFPKPLDVSNIYYDSMQKSATQNEAFWVYLFDTALKDGEEYIKSIEHGYVTTKGKAIYPSTKPGCSHFFKYALARRGQGYYHTYIYNPEVPDSLKTDTNFSEKFGSDENIVIVKQNYKEVDWREIIYQMAKDYYKYQHDDDFLANVAANNRDYYPLGHTGYEQYYIDLEGFWRQIYNPDVRAIDLNEINPQDFKHYYIWDEDKSEFDEYTFREATQVDDIDISKNYFYFDGTIKAETLIAEAQQLNDKIQFTQTEKQKVLKSLRAEDYPTYEAYQEAYQKTLEYYTNAENESKQNFNTSTSRLLLPAVNDDGTIDLEKADAIIAEIYPDYKNIKPGLWEKYKRYNNFNKDRSYYLYQFVKDLTPLSNKKTYYISNDMGGFIPYTETTMVEDLTAEPDSLGVRPKIKVPNFMIGKKYYTDEGYEKASTLKVVDKERGSFYYTYDAYVLPTEYDPKKTYYLRQESHTVHSVVDSEKEKTTYIFSPTNIAHSSYFDKTKHYIRVENPNLADKTLCRGYCLKLYLDPKKTYYSRTLVHGKMVIDEPKFFTRGNTYYDKDGNVEFTFERGVVYYLYKGYVEALDLKTSFSFDDYYVDFDSGEISTTLALGRVYYGYIKQPTDSDFKNGEYFMTEDGGKTFQEYEVLKEFKRGGTYYIYEKGYDKIDPYSDFNSDKTYYIYDNISGKYTSIKDIVEQEKGLNLKLTKVQMNKLNASYGLKIDELGNIYGLGKGFDFYINKDDYRPVKYYSFSFYKKTTKPIPNTEYYILDRADYKSVGKIPEEDFYKGPTYYIKLDNTKLKVYTTNEYNATEDEEKKHLRGWTLKLQNPELLNFWFDFLDLEDGGELAQFSVQNIGDRPKTINDDSIKAIYYRDTPTVIFCGADGAFIKTFINSETYKSKKSKLYEKDERDHYKLVAEDSVYSANKDYYRKMTPEDKQPGYTYVNLQDTVENLFSISAQGKSTFTELDNCLYQNSQCAQSITLTSVPIYYLQPNTRIFVHDDKSGIDGEYIVSRISLSLQYNGTMSITATRAVDRIY